MAQKNNGAILIRWEDFARRVPQQITQHKTTREATALGQKFKESRRRRFDVIALSSIK